MLAKGSVPIFRAKAIRIAANWFPLPEKKKPRSESTRLRRLFEYPKLPRGTACSSSVEQHAIRRWNF